ncbi:MAG TPA: hypothetical protein VHF08_06900 [Nitrososphaeraceae archaeon]|nr:hypothetical protein [Nitrososphaeraceae archaeon]
MIQKCTTKTFSDNRVRSYISKHLITPEELADDPDSNAASSIAEF